MDPFQSLDFISIDIKSKDNNLICIKLRFSSKNIDSTYTFGSEKDRHTLFIAQEPFTDKIT